MTVWLPLAGPVIVPPQRLLMTPALTKLQLLMIDPRSLRGITVFKCVVVRTNRFV